MLWCEGRGKSFCMFFSVFLLLLRFTLGYPTPEQVQPLFDWAIQHGSKVGEHRARRNMEIME